ncbi:MULTISPECIES: polysaccharide biosynthesis tyrosine autokinase [unclassified Pseudonocardia]|uniref:polysaccharide biosynthesis tyrosine autokinase n=1 Tax=unclassified Pseudonocardia TaxID=2619320 RepID=UPI000527ABBC|nr:polysaccharide biosynthesis tyrosine autokinase [Pseudonocardia sp. Ae707_Ps1]OLM20213.1 Tyrosine-protein kinase EpsD [Pseudonocardia sp. Ae707_Ps1]
MNLRGHLRVLGERWIVIAVCVGLGMLSAAAVSFGRSPEYTAQTSLFVTTQVVNNPQDAYQGAQLSQDRITSYVELVTGDRVLGETGRRLGLATTPADLAAQVGTSSSPNSVIFGVTATDPSPQRAADIANTVAEVTGEVVGELERPQNDQNLTYVGARVIQPAAVPDTPSSPGAAFLLALGLAVGLVIGVVAAYVRDALDNTVTTSDEAAAIVKAPALGAVLLDPSVPATPLTVHESPNTPISENFRRIRTNLQFVDVDKPRKVVVVTSGVAGEGKSTTTANLATAVASTGRRVLLIEGDLRRPGVSALFGVDRAVGLTTVLSGGLSLGRAVHNWGGGSLDLLPSGALPPNPSELLGSNQMRTLLHEARVTYDLVLIDTPPVLPVADAAALLPATDGALLLCGYGRTTTQQLSSASHALRAVSGNVLGVILTLVPARRIGRDSGYDGTYESVRDGQAGGTYRHGAAEDSPPRASAGWPRSASASAPRASERTTWVQRPGR